MRPSLSLGLRVSAAGLAALALALVYPASPRAISPNVVISQVYGGGGNSGATLKNDFIELYNRGDSPVSVDGWSVQYASSAGSSWQKTVLTGTIQPRAYYLVQQAAGSGGTVSLPTPDVTGTIPMSATAGKVALVNNVTTLTGTCPTGLIDFVGFGGSTNCSETAPTALLSNTTAALRKDDGALDTDNNSADFSIGAPNPRSSTPRVPTPPTGLASAVPSAVEPGASTLLSVKVTPGTNPVSSGITVRADLTTIGGTADQLFFDNGTNGDATAGDLRFSFAVTVAPSTTTGNKSMAVTVGDAQGRTTSTAIALKVFIATRVAIHDIQGNGTATPYLDQPVVTSGIVTAVRPQGFFLQVPDALADADPNSSEGLYVFTNSTPTVTAGDAVSVLGTATEYFNLTELTGTTVTFMSSGNELPSPITVTTGLLSVAQAERFEGMRMQTGTLRTVSATDFGEVYTVPADLPRPMREPGAPASLALPPDPLSNAVEEGVTRWDENLERIIIDTDGLLGAPALHLTSNVTMSAVTGPLDFTFGTYKLLPETTPLTSPNMAAVPVPAPAANEFTIAGYNIENFTGGATQLAKAALNIRQVMRSPDVIGAIEIKNLAALQALAARVNADAVAAGETDPHYEAYLIPAPAQATDNTPQEVGFLVKASRVLVHDVWQYAGNDRLPNGLFLHDRPPLVLDATIDPAGINPGRVFVVVNHPRSFIDIELDDAEGARVRDKRTRQAESIAALLNQLQTDNPTTPVIAVGDYNAFEFSDGYTDPLSVITGNPTPGDQIVYTGSPDLVDPDYVNLTNTLPADQRYSFVFEGTPQALDHVIVNSVARRYFQRYAVARSNADFPGATAAGYSSNPARPEGNSDHDQPVAYFAFAGSVVLTLQGGAVYNHEAFTPYVDPGYAAHDGFESLPVTVTGAVDVSTPGTYQLTYTASNFYDTMTVTRTVIVADTTAPAISGFAVTPAYLGVPNHKMVDVSVPFAVADGSNAATCAVAVGANEPANGRGDGNTETDIEVLGLHQLRLRAERSGTGTSRIYTITVTCTDPSGNASTASGTVVVRHDSR